jgi:serine/threonine protein phosphatase PrpC
MADGSPPVPRLLTRQSLESPEVHPIAQGTVVVFTAASPAKESDNEDAAAIIAVDEARAVLAVADGLGGQRSGAEAAELALKTLAECVRAPAGEDQMLRTAVLDGFERANSRVTELAVGAATTLAAVEVEDATIRPYHVGDSMILVVGQRGKVKLCTVSHSPVGYAVEAGLLDEKEAIHHEDRHLVSNIVGTPEMRIEVGRTLSLRPRDTLVLGSDGLFDNLHLEEITEYVRKGPLPRAGESLASACRRRMCEPQPDHPCKPDDLTFLLYRRRG